LPTDSQPDRTCHRPHERQPGSVERRKPLDHKAARRTG
jgi:hypothetical protein